MNKKFLPVILALILTLGSVGVGYAVLVYINNHNFSEKNIKNLERVIELNERLERLKREEVKQKLVVIVRKPIPDSQDQDCVYRNNNCQQNRKE